MPQTNKSNPLSKNITPFLIIGLVVASFFIGSLYSKVKLLEKGTTATTDNTADATPTTTAAAPPQQPKTTTASVDDDAVLGDKNAPITMIEFSDYECPFCKRHATETAPQLIKEYVDTGKVKIIFRDLPLPFHEPMASKEAIAANCAREQGGDKKYYEYHDEVYKRTTSNGNGLNDEKIQTIATDLGLNINKFNACLKDTSQAEEVKKDTADGQAAGISGTPSFVIGKSSDSGQIEGTFIVGAQPYSVFQSAIDSLL